MRKATKNFLGIALVFAMLFSLCLVPTAFAEDGPDKWDGTADTSWYNDTDVEFVLYTAEELAGFGQLVDEGNTFAGKTVKLGNSIDLGLLDANGEQVSFDPIGYGYNVVFKGTFDGQDNTIVNLYQNGWALGYSYGTQGGGLFASVVDATIKNLTVDNAEIVMECVDMGIVVGYSYGDCTYENIDIKNSLIANYQRYTGGVVGEVNGTQTFTDITVDENTVVSSLWGDFDCSLGGIIGGKWGEATVTLKDCYVACQINAYSDVTSSYQWYAYRRAGMLVGNAETFAGNAATADWLTVDNCTVVYGDWANYTYCEFAGTSWPYVRVQAGYSNDAYSNPRYGHPTDANGDKVVDDNHVHNEGEDHFILIKFDQLYGGGQGVYGEPEHEGTEVVYPPVAEIGDAKYASLQGAVDAAVDGDTVKLLADITLTDDDIVKVGSYGVMVNVDGKAITLDLNGKTITVDYEGGQYLYAVIFVADGAELTVVGEGAIDVPENGENVAYMFWKRGTTGALTIENGTYHMNDTADSMVYTNGHEIVTVAGGTFTLDSLGTGENGSPWVFNAQGTGGKSVIITGGSFNADINRQHWSDEAVVAKDHYVIEENGYWTVKEGAVAYVNEGMLTGPYYAPKDVGYATFEEAVAAATAKNDSSVTLLKDVEVTGDIVIGEGLEVICGEYQIVLADADATLTASEGLNVATYVDGCKVVYADGIYTVVTVIYVAEINGTGYESLAEAVAAAADGDTITLLTDVVLTDTLLIPADKNIILDLAGKTISQTKEQTAGYQMILIDGALTVEDTVGGGKISYTDSGNGGEYISDTIYNRGVLVINGGTIENLSSATVATNGYPHAVDTYSGIRDTSVTINGGTVYCAEYSAIRMFCVSETYKADLVINGGTIKGAVDMQNGTTAAANGSLTVTGGTFETTKNANNIRFANWNGGASTYGITASVTGGSFNGGISTAYVPAAANWNSKFITGGTFAVDPSEYIAEGYEVVESNGTYGVESAPEVIEIRTWEDLKALDARVEGGDMLEGVIVKLMNDIDLYEMGTDDEPVSFNPIGANTAYFKGTFDGQGYTIRNMYQSGWALGYDWDNYGTIGLFAYLWDATVKNLTIENAECFVEGGNVAGIAGCAWGDCTFENITIKNSTYATYNNRAAGIVGYTGGEGTMTFKNITVDEDTVIAALWGSYDCTLGGVVGSTHTNNVTKYVFEDVTVACKLDCYNDVTASYKWCSYRMCGMLIGSMKALQDGTTDVDPRDTVTLKNVKITIGEWANQTYIWDDSLSKGCQRVEAGYSYDGVDVSQYPDAEVETIGFNTIIGGPQSQKAGYYGSDITKLEALEGFEEQAAELEVEDIALEIRSRVAKVGDEYFDSLAEAIAAADGKTVILVADVTLADTLTIPAGVTVTLDLNGYTISQTKACTESYEMIANNGSLTITGNGTISFTDTGAGDSEATWGAYTIRNSGTLVVENGTIENLSAQNQAGQPFAHTTLAIFQYSGSTTINGGKISTPNYRSLRLWSGDVTINGGELDGQVWVHCVNDTAKLTINGGEFSPNGNDGSSVFVNNSGYEAELSVTGGAFATRIGADAPAALNGDLITGGTFTAAAANGTNLALLGEDMEFVENSDGSYGVEFIPPVAKIGDQFFFSVSEALDAAYEAGTKDVVITLIGETNASTTDSVDLYNKYGNGTAFNTITFRQEDASKAYYLKNLYTGWTTGKVSFDGVNIVVTTQLYAIGKVELVNNATITRSSDVANFVFYGDMLIEPGSKFVSQVDRISSGSSLTVDGGRTDGAYNTAADYKTVWLYVEAGNTMTIKNGAYVIVSNYEYAELEVSGTVNVLDSKLDVCTAIRIGANGVFNVNSNSVINTKSIIGSGKIVLDAAGLTEGAVAAFKNVNLSGFTGTVELANAAENLKAEIVDGVLHLKSTTVGGTWGGIDWTLTEDGTLTIAPTKGTPVADPNSGKTYEVGAWREAVRYDSKGEGVAVEGWPYDRTKVKKLVIEEGVTSIGSFTAQGFTNLTGEVIIPSTVTYIGQEAFQKSTFTKLTFAAGGTEELCIAQGAFKNLIIEEVALPADRPVHLHAWVFNNCHNLKYATLPATVVSVHGTNHIDYFKDFNAHSNPTWTKASEIFAYNENMETITFGSEEVRDMFFANSNGTSKDYIVAHIGLVAYSSLKDAVNAAQEGDTITLVKNVVLTETLIIPADANVTLDLNGKTVSMVYSATATANHTMISNNGNLTITGDGGKLSYKYTGGNLGTTYSANTVTTNPGSVLTVLGGTIENLTYDSATIAYAIDGLTNGGAGDVTVEIKGGTVTSKRQAVRIFANSTTNTGTLNISGGEITGRVIIQNANTSENKAVLAITGGTFNANEYKTDVLYVGGSNGATIDMNAVVSGGTFNGEITSSIPEKFITGGTYSYDPSEYLHIDYCAVGTDDGRWSVAPKPYVVELLDSEGVRLARYLTLDEALAAASSGKTVKLLADTETTSLVVRTGITVDLAGHNLTADYVVTFKGAAIIDSNSQIKDAQLGSLIAPKSFVRLEGQNGNYAPVWNGEAYNFGYTYVRVFNSGTDETGAITYTFRYDFTGGRDDLESLFANDDSALIKVKLTWTTVTGNISEQSFTMPREKAQNMAEIQNLKVNLTVTGLSGIQELGICVIIESTAAQAAVEGGTVTLSVAG